MILEDPTVYHSQLSHVDLGWSPPSDIGRIVGRISCVDISLYLNQHLAIVVSLHSLSYLEFINNVI